MAEEVRAPQPQNPAADPELPQPQTPQQVEVREPDPLVVPIVIRDPEGPLRESAAGQGIDPLPGRTTLFEPASVFQPIGVPLEGDVGLGQTSPGFDGAASVFQPIGVPIEGDAGLGVTTPGFDVPSVFQPIGVPIEGDAGLGVTTPGFDGAAPPFLPNEEALAANLTTAALREAQDQSTTQQRFNQTTEGDWRVRIRLLQGADYLYKAPSQQLQGILAPLAESDGVIFPYTPTVTTNYRANYQSYDLTHSNIRGYFYQNSHAGDIGINGTFTAQDTKEAAYLLAVIHFFRSVTKMFYGQDQFRGAPPPVVTLSGYGQYQFNEHPCLVQNFNYSLPSDVDYIRVNPNNQGLNLSPRAPRQNTNRLTFDSVLSRLRNANIPVGAETDLGLVDQTVSGTGQTTYVPTRMDIQLVLLPLQTRSQVSKQFSLRDFASGSLLSKGFW